MRARVMRVALVVAAASLALTACVGDGGDQPTPTAEPTIHVTAPPVPALDLGGTAESNLEFFDIVNRELIDGDATLNGRAFIDNLVEAGYPKSDMEVTSDRTAINGAADNIQFSVRLNGTCLIGQWGNIGYASTATTLLATGTCLVGDTRKIDW